MTWHHYLEIRFLRRNFAARQITSDMKSFVPTLVRTVIIFAVFCGLQYIIPYYLLALGGIIAGAFMLKTGDDRPLALGVLIGSVAFAIFAYAMAQIYPAAG